MNLIVIVFLQKKNYYSYCTGLYINVHYSVYIGNIKDNYDGEYI